MEEFLNKLYNYEYFGIYLIISIIVLVILFCVILFLGKKDQREREKTATLKLQQINSDAFKDESIEEKLEIPNVLSQDLENDTIIVPNIGDLTETPNELNDEIPEPVLPEIPESNDFIYNEPTQIIEPILNEMKVEPEVEIPMEVNAPTYESIEEVKEDINVTPLLEKVEEKPLMFNDINNEIIIPDFSKEFNVEVPVAPAVEEEIEVPTFNFDEIVKGVEETKKEQTYTKGPEIFSSVYVPKKEEVEIPKIEVPEIAFPKVEPVNDLGIELPTLKKEVVKEQKIEETTPVIEAQAEEKTEDKIEIPVLNDYNLDSLSGEIYNINK